MGHHLLFLGRKKGRKQIMIAAAFCRGEYREAVQYRTVHSCVPLHFVSETCIPPKNEDKMKFPSGIKASTKILPGKRVLLCVLGVTESRETARFFLLSRTLYILEPSSFCRANSTEQSRRIKSSLSQYSTCPDIRLYSALLDNDHDE